MKTIRTLKDYFLERWGSAVQRIPVDLGLSCPHRGADGSGGCLFCAPDGSRARHLREGMTLEEQIERGIAYARSRYHAEAPYALYFQAFTSTNAPAETLRELYRRGLEAGPFHTVIFATRPDCLPPEAVTFIMKITPLSTNILANSWRSIISKEPLTV